LPFSVRRDVKHRHGALNRQERPELYQSKNHEATTGGRQDEMTETMWKYEQLRAGQIYNQVMFNTREEAESFAAQMTRVEPDLFWRIEPIEARLWWN
jgi:hypothetical protein